MIIEIKDFPKNVKRVILEFGENGESETIIESNSNNKLSKKTANKEHVNREFDKPLDLNFGTNTQVSQEIIKKPEIPDVKRDIKVSNSMQNLKI